MTSRRVLGSRTKIEKNNPISISKEISISILIMICYCYLPNNKLEKLLRPWT
jgi:hypothetical protein